MSAANLVNTWDQLPEDIIALVLVHNEDIKFDVAVDIANSIDRSGSHEQTMALVKDELMNRGYRLNNPNLAPSR